jgi:hypothetical protein
MFIISELSKLQLLTLLKVEPTSLNIVTASDAELSQEIRTLYHSATAGFEEKF